MVLYIARLEISPAAMIPDTWHESLRWTRKVRTRGDFGAVDRWGGRVKLASGKLT